MRMWRKGILGRGNSKCKVPEARAYLAFLCSREAVLLQESESGER